MRSDTMKSFILGNMIFAIQKSADGKWIHKGKLLSWLDYVPMKKGISFKFGSYMLGIMVE
jgi:hypothetical protein